MNSIITSSSSSLAEYPDLLTVGELQEVLRIGRNATYEAIRRNDIAVVHIGRSIRIPKLAVIKFLSDGA
jgi:excisionase family DNA binding protein